MAGARLLYRDANGGEAAVDIPPEGVFLGRGNDCAVRTDDAMVSRKNCRISLQAGRWVAEDLGSSNGTFVNGVRIQKQVLTHADVVRCGTLQVRFVESAPPPARVGPPDVNPHVDPSALLAERDQKVRESNEARDRLRGELEQLQLKLEQAHAVNAELKRDNGALAAEVEKQMRISDGLRLELEAVREKLVTGETRVVELEVELKAARAQAVELRARLEANPVTVDGQLAGPTLQMPVAIEATPLPRATTLPFPIAAPLVGAAPPAATVPDMPAVSGVDVAIVAVDHALAELRASLVVARTLVAEPGVVVPSTARAVVVALENATKRADDAQETLRGLRDAR